jgi:hypothetical protein
VTRRWSVSVGGSEWAIRIDKAAIADTKMANLLKDLNGAFTISSDARIRILPAVTGAFVPRSPTVDSQVG